jgi:hypothetical protein
VSQRHGLEAAVAVEIIGDERGACFLILKGFVGPHQQALIIFVHAAIVATRAGGRQTHACLLYRDLSHNALAGELPTFNIGGIGLPNIKHMCAPFLCGDCARPPCIFVVTECCCWCIFSCVGKQLGCALHGHREQSPW